jgi:hypothetical protein
MPRFVTEIRIASNLKYLTWMLKESTEVRKRKRQSCKFSSRADLEGSFAMSSMLDYSSNGGEEQSLERTASGDWEGGASNSSNRRWLSNSGSRTPARRWGSFWKKNKESESTLSKRMLMLEQAQHKIEMLTTEVENILQGQRA